MKTQDKFPSICTRKIRFFEACDCAKSAFYIGKRASWRLSLALKKILLSIYVKTKRIKMHAPSLSSWHICVRKIISPFLPFRRIRCWCLLRPDVFQLLKPLQLQPRQLLFRLILQPAQPGQLLPLLLPQPGRRQWQW